MQLAQLAAAAGSEHRREARRALPPASDAEDEALRPHRARAVLSRLGRAARSSSPRSERPVLAGALHFDEAARTAHHNIHIDRGRARPLRSRGRVAASCRSRRHSTAAHTSLHGRRRQPGPARPTSSNASTAATQRAGDRGRPRSAVGHEHVAIQSDRELAEPEVVEHGANAPPDEPLNLLRPPARAASAHANVRVLVARGSIAYSAVEAILRPCRDASRARLPRSRPCTAPWSAPNETRQEAFRVRRDATLERDPRRISSSGARCFWGPIQVATELLDG